MRSPNILNLGYYATHLVHYFDVFPPDQLHFEIYESLFADSAAGLRRILSFLEIDDSFSPHNVQDAVNAYSPPPSRLVRRAKRAIWSVLAQPWAHPVKDILHKLRINRVNYQTNSGSESNSNCRPELQPETRQQLITRFNADISRLEDLISRDLSAWRTACDASNPPVTPAW